MQPCESSLNSSAKDKTFGLDLQVISAYAYLASIKNNPYRDKVRDSIRTVFKEPSRSMNWAGLKEAATPIGGDLEGVKLHGEVERVHRKD